MEPVIRYFSPLSSDLSRATSMAHRMYSDTDSSSMPMNRVMRSPLITVSIIPVAAASTSPVNSLRRPAAAGSPHPSSSVARAAIMMTQVISNPKRSMRSSPLKATCRSPHWVTVMARVATMPAMPMASGRRRADAGSGTTASTIAATVTAAITYRVSAAPAFTGAPRGRWPGSSPRARVARRSAPPGGPRPPGPAPAPDRCWHGWPPPGCRATGRSTSSSGSGAPG